MSNPYRIGQSLFVHFGNRQRFVVVALSAERCAMRFPNTLTPAVRWYSVADLRRWNPDSEPRAIVPVYIPVQYPAVVPGLRVVRQWHDPIATFPTCEDYTVLAVLRGVVYVRHNTPELPGSITDKLLRTFWQGRGAIQTRYEALTLQGHELRTIAAIHRANCAGRNYYMGRFNAGMDLLTPRLWERLQIEFAYRKTRRLLDAGLKVAI